LQHPLRNELPTPLDEKGREVVRWLSEEEIERGVAIISEPTIGGDLAAVEEIPSGMEAQVYRHVAEARFITSVAEDGSADLSPNAHYETNYPLANFLSEIEAFYGTNCAGKARLRNEVAWRREERRLDYYFRRANWSRPGWG
jgi:hypothetical protein